MSDDIEIRLLKEKRPQESPPPLSGRTRRKFIMLVIGVVVLFVSCVTALSLQYQIGRLQNATPEKVIRYATFTPESMANRVIPTAVLLPTSTPMPDDTPTDSIGPIIAFNNNLLFVADKPEATELWRTVGSATNPRKIADLGILDFSDFQFIPYGDQLLIRLVDTQTGQNRYWKIGPTYGVARIEELPVLTFHDYKLEVDQYEVFARSVTSEFGQLVSIYRDSRIERELDISVHRWSANSAILYHDSILFAGGSILDGYELWRTVGTQDGVFLVMDIRPNDVPAGAPAEIRSSFPADFVLLGDEVIFTAAAPHSAARNIWLTAGTEISTKMLTRFSFEQTETPQSVAVTQDGRAAVIPTVQHVFFFTNTDGSGAWDGQLWVSNGTIAGTNWIKDFLPAAGATSAKVPLTVVVDNQLYLIVPSAENEQTYELWVSDGTSTGTNWLFTFESDTSPSLVATAENIYFAFNQNGQGHFSYYRPETDRLRELALPSGFEPIQELVALNNKIYFANRVDGQSSLVFLADITMDNLYNFQFRYPREQD